MLSTYERRNLRKTDQILEHGSTFFGGTQGSFAGWVGGCMDLSEASARLDRSRFPQVKNDFAAFFLARIFQKKEKI